MSSIIQKIKSIDWENITEANLKHGVSEVHSGERHTLGIIFHDAEK